MNDAITSPRLGDEKETSVRPICSSRSLIAAGGAGVEMQAPRRQVGVAVALVLFAALALLDVPYTCTCAYLHHETPTSTSHLPLIW